MAALHLIWALLAVANAATFLHERYNLNGTEHIGLSVSKLVTLKVGLYPYVPRLQQFKDVFRDMWRRRDIRVEFDEKWDGGYGMDPNVSALDAFVFDGIFLDYVFCEQGLLEGNCNISN